MAEENAEKNSEELRKIRDHIEITEVINRYGRGIHQDSPDLVASCFSDDAHLEYGYIDVDGIDNVRSFFDGSLPELASKRSSRMGGLESKALSTPIMTNIMINLEGDTAHVESMCLAVHVGTSKGESTVVVRGTTNIDDFVRTSSGWKILRRTHRALWKFETPGVVLRDS